MKNYWPLSIVFAFGAFMAFIITLVIKTYAVNHELVADDYYAQEIAYEQKMAKMKRVNDSNCVRYTLTNTEVILQYAHPDTQGMVVFYRPSATAQDMAFEIKPDPSGQQRIPRAIFPTGLYKIKIDWQSQGLAYYLEEDLYLP